MLSGAMLIDFLQSNIIICQKHFYYIQRILLKKNESSEKIPELNIWDFNSIDFNQ